MSRGGFIGRNVLAAAVGCASIAALAAASAQLRPKGVFSIGSGGVLSYDPAKACARPVRTAAGDAASAEAYRKSASDYLNCLQTAAAADVRYASSAVLSGYNETVAAFSEEIQNSY